MRLLINENFPYDAVVALREKGHDVHWVRTDAPGSSDADILTNAITEGRILVTFDKDFGELAFHARLPASCGVILFRTPSPSSDYVARLATLVIDSRTDWTGNFAVVEEHRVRIRPLPPTD